MIVASFDDPSPIQPMLRILEILSSCLRASVGIGAVPPPRLQLASIMSIVSSGSIFWAFSAGARSTPAQRTCGLPAASLLRIDSQQYSRLSSPERSTDICADGLFERELSMRNTAQCWQGSETRRMLPQG